MTAPFDPTGLDTVVCDLDGVVWLSGVPIPGAVEAIHRLRAAGLRVVYVTNSSGPTIAEHTAALARVGLRAEGLVLSSAVAASQLLTSGERVLVCGGDGVREAVEAAGAIAVAGDDERGALSVDAVVVGLHREFTYDRLRIAVTALRLGARFIACNRDPLFPTPAGKIPGAGSIVAAVATSAEREPEVAGKPHQPAVDSLARLLGFAPGDPAFGSALLMVGDQHLTDGRYANRIGCQFALVRTGNTPSGAPLDYTPALDVPDLSAVASAVLAGG